MSMKRRLADFAAFGLAMVGALNERDLNPKELRARMSSDHRPAKGPKHRRSCSVSVIIIKNEK